MPSPALPGSGPRRPVAARLSAALALAALAAALLPACGGGDENQEAASADVAYVAAVDSFHAERMANLKRPDGWLSLVGLHPLPAEGEVTLGSAAASDVRLIAKAPPRLGSLRIDAEGIEFTAAAGVDVRIVGEPESGPVATTPLVTDVDGVPTELAVGSLLLQVIDRDDDLFLRVKDTDSELRRTFGDIERFPVDRRWRVTARLAAREGGTVAVPNVLGQTSEAPCPGILEFELAGRVCHLRPIGALGEPLFIVFGDRTNGESTYGGGRFLSTEPLGGDGVVVLDFNRATNPPCAFTPYATCPLPPEGNVLPIAVEAGEKAWGEPGAAHGGGR